MNAQSLADCPCPVCGHGGIRDRDDLANVDCTCLHCGWHYTSAAARAELERLEREVEAECE